ncbi:MAG: hypothetical protein A2Y17_11555 [Clostridiales bacterium GWF2_38_85]|nr:MAG: hypothetical protein A2Y17_11555 [Clostridiales bacterium GWF2_38_85]HBL83988.1 cell division protein FtsX [Clostridiales bacterium]
MRKLYWRIAAINIKKNGKLYFPYILTCILTVMMFYIMCSLQTNPGLSKLPGSDALKAIMVLACIIIAIFAGIFLFYTNSFLIKGRKKEFGLYNILGMGKRHIARVFSIETLYVGISSIVVGLGTGFLFDKLAILLLCKLLKFNIPFGFYISKIGIILSVIVFAAIFFLILLWNLKQVHFSKPIELLYGGNHGEKEPKTKWVLALFGFITLGTGYTIAIITEKPLSALGLFFIAVLLVIIGTYCLFIAGSIVFLKALRKNKNYYYKTNHFISVSGMMYRMKQNAAGLASICILSTMVLVMLSTTISLYFGMEDALRKQYPRDIEINAGTIGEQDAAAMGDALDSLIEQSCIKTKNLVKYRYANQTLLRDGDAFYPVNNHDVSGEETATIFITVDEYNRIQGKSDRLNNNEVIIYTPNNEYSFSDACFSELKYTIKTKIDSLNVEEYYSLQFMDVMYFIVPIEQDIYDIVYQDKNIVEWNTMRYYYGIDVDDTEEKQIELANKISEYMNNYQTKESPDAFWYTSSVAQNKNDFLAIYGGLFFMGIFLGVLFIMATVLIMYYKQITEGYDDRKRFDIMQKVGMCKSDVRKSIRSQVLIVFFMPLVAAGIHIAFAFKMITRLLLVLNLTNTTLFALCMLGTFVLFALLYTLVYLMTAKVYYKIVE